MGLGVQKGEENRLTDNIAEITRSRQQNSAKKEELVKARESAKQKINSLRDSLKAAEKDLASAQARLESLEEMQKNYRSYGQGVRFLLKDDESGEKAALLGPLAEMIDVPREFQKALTAALGDRLGHMVVSSTARGRQSCGQAQGGRSRQVHIYPFISTTDSGIGTRCSSRGTYAASRRGLLSRRL